MWGGRERFLQPKDKRKKKDKRELHYDKKRSRQPKIQAGRTTCTSKENTKTK
jgi:hypothetical protein